MGDRYFDPRHPNIELLLRRPPQFRLPDFRLPGIGHNGGPPLDMSWTGWLWRRALAKAWQTPPREIALRRLARAERLGLSYREYTAALMDTGTALGVALLPLHYAAEIRRGVDGGLHLVANPRIADCIARFDGRLLILIDEAITGPLDAAARRRLATAVRQLFGDRVEAVVALAFRAGETEAQTATRLQRKLKTHRVLRRECFLLGVTLAEFTLAEQAGLGYAKPVSGWFAALD